jgi:hypothetical protein
MRRLRSLLVAAALVASGTALGACGSTDTGAPGGASTAPFVTSGDCPREKALVRRALARSTVRVDVSGDGVEDRVAVASDASAEQGCRGFVGVRVAGGSTYSTHLFRLAVPLKGLPARIMATPHLGDGAGAQIVVDTRAAADALLGQMFTLTGSGLRVVRVPPFRDGTFIVEGGGVVYPQGTACTTDGRLVHSEAALSKDGKRYRVTRRTYELLSDGLRVGDPEVKTGAVATRSLVQRFPEFGRPHWSACDGQVSR